LLAILTSILLHFSILYIEFFRNIFSTCSLDYNDWILVLRFSIPILVLDEILKFVARKKEMFDESNEKDLELAKSN